MSFCHRLAEVSQVIGKTLLLLTDVKFLDVVYEFLLKAVLVILYVGYLFESIDNACAYFFNTCLLEWLDAEQKLLYIVNLFAKLLLQRSAFLCAECNELVDGFVDGGICHLPLFGSERFCLSLRHDVGHAQKSDKPVGRQRNLALLCHVLYLLAVVLCQFGVDVCSVGVGILLHPNGKVYLAAQQVLLYVLTYFHLLFAIERGDASGQIKRLAVERLYLNVDFLSVKDCDRLAVASH